jgi:ribosomal protein L34
MAVLRVIADAARGNGAQCVKSVAEIAARAGVCHRLAQYAIRLAEREGLLIVEERRQKGRPNLVNIVRIICAEWLAWVRHRVGCRKMRSTTNRFPSKSASEGWSVSLRPSILDAEANKTGFG